MGASCRQSLLLVVAGVIAELPPAGARFQRSRPQKFQLGSFSRPCCGTGRVVKDAKR